MPIDLGAPVADPALVVVAALAGGCYTVFHYLASPPVARWWARRRGAPTDDDAVRTTVAYGRRVLGFVLLGIVPTAVAAAALPWSLDALGLGLGDPALAVGLGLAMAALTFPATWLASRRPFFRATYPEVRTRPWTRRVAVANAASWALYLVGYEAFFRGVLLFGLAHLLGPWPAIALTTALYAYAHLPKHAGEGLGALIAGVAFAAGALACGSVLMPFVAHLVQAVAADTLAARPASQGIAASAVQGAG